MAVTIYKWKLKKAELQSIIMPNNTKILSVQMQSGELCLWGIVDLSQPLVHRSILLVGTGWGPYPDHALEKYIATVQDGDFVWHIFYDTGLMPSASKNGDENGQG